MKKLWMATIAAAATLASGSAMAADMAPAYRPAPPPAPAPVYNWTGFYVGGAWGYALWDADTSITAGGATGGVTNNGGRGWIGQAIAGYDYQFAVANLNLVAGVFADYDFGNVKGTFSSNTSSGPVSIFAGPESERSFWSVGGRIGLLVTPQVLTYWDGGYTEANFNGVTFAAQGAQMSMPSHTYQGWFVGGGVEYQASFLPGLYFNTEYRFANYSQASLPLTNTGAAIGFASANMNIHPYEQTVLSGVKYKFNWSH
jgi:outer membrane immunogenic protein